MSIKNMSIKKMAAAALSGLFLTSTALADTSGTPAISDTPDTNSCSGKLVFNNFDETIKGGEAHIKPLDEVSLTLKCAKRFSLAASGDFTSSKFGDYQNMRRERLALTYKAGDLSNPLEITAGFLGEQRKFKAIFTAPGQRPSVGFERSMIVNKIDNPDLVGISLKKSFALQDGWKVKLKGSAFGVFNQNEKPVNIMQDRANSKNLSFTGSSTFSKKGVSFGVEGGKIQNGVLGDAPETFVGVYGQYKTAPTPNTVWKSGFEIIYMDNFKNQSDVNKTLSVAYSNIEWKPKSAENIALWSQIGANFDSLDTDKIFLETGGRWTVIKREGLSIFVFAAVDLAKELGDTQKTQWDRQIGLRMVHEF